ncbi:hypothetical protein J2X72_001146 [Phyllobacterium sp. 1468]|uniref:hypothetical protein n=1 Tax=Phyllobacterium sp. 1468 TaxID=2817759 RepID=UPI001AE285CC|nr:hypothetical protein [Phyllobacterium sp. 1468]MDR6632362.1 hypothetical protein [Phyllobacterium sp. 1468]
MVTRVKHSVVQFAHPFTLPGIEGTMPPGEYGVDEDEEIIDGMLLVSYRRVATYITVPARNIASSKRQVFAINYGELSAALEWDREPRNPPPS